MGEAAAAAEAEEADRAEGNARREPQPPARRAEPGRRCLRPGRAQKQHRILPINIGCILTLAAASEMHAQGVQAVELAIVEKRKPSLLFGSQALLKSREVLARSHIYMYI